MTIKSPLKARSSTLRILYTIVRTLKSQFGCNFRWVLGIKSLLTFAAEYRCLRELNRGTPFELRGRDIYPQLTDRTVSTPIEPTYFLQDAWCARKIAKARPSSHVDVGSSIRAMSLIAQFVPVKFVDIRRIDIEVKNLTFELGSITELPLAERSVSSISSLCVIEHIGLGRYGDPMDAHGSEKAAAELMRVLSPRGDLYVSVPVDDVSRIYFNAHRAFTREYILSLFSNLRLVEERYIYGSVLTEHYLPSRGFGTGLYHFTRE